MEEIKDFNYRYVLSLNMSRQEWEKEPSATRQKIKDEIVKYANRDGATPIGEIEVILPSENADPFMVTAMVKVAI